MFRIREVHDDIRPVNRAAILQVQAILRAQFPLLREKVIQEIPERLHNPLKYKFRSLLFVAEGDKAQVEGFAFVFHEPEMQFCYLDFMAANNLVSGRGIGGALYERVRQEALALQSVGLFFECLPDDPALAPDPAILKQNAARLRFYERYGARPIIDTAYETPISPQSLYPPYLVFDDLGRGVPLPRERARVIVRTILEREYGHVCSKEYIDTVVDSFRDPSVQLRAPRYGTKERLPLRPEVPRDLRIVLVVNDRHSVHHVRDRGYVESPVRIKTILKEIGDSGLFENVPARSYGESHIRSVHDSEFVNYFKKVCGGIPDGQSVYPYVFPIRNVARPPKELSVRAGYYCIDTFTPLNKSAHAAAERAVDCALTAADAILRGRQLAYALVRPPGHHAERRSFGGFCYFNSTAIAAQHLSAFGKVAILDIDYHHGNGQQDIFYERADVMTISIHGHPSIAYPYFSGFVDEKGRGAGQGFNVNIPLPEKVFGVQYQEALERALRQIRNFHPIVLVVALGLDTAKGDPTGSWSLQAKDFEANGAMIGAMKLPTLVVQEGGYNNRNLGLNARRFFWGLWEGMHDRKTEAVASGTARGLAAKTEDRSQLPLETKDTSPPNPPA